MMKMLVLSLLFYTLFSLHSQTPSIIHDYTVIKESEWIIPHSDTVSYTFAIYDSANALLLKRNAFDTKIANIAYPKDLIFRDGIIEADIASPNGGGYLGLAFRIKNAHHYETVYFRTASSYTPEAMQYMPERKEEFNWWSYTDLKYQAKAKLPFKKWFHVKLMVKGTNLTVFVNNDEKPIFMYNDLDENIDSGSVGFYFGNCTSGAYKSLVIKSL